MNVKAKAQLAVIFITLLITITHSYWHFQNRKEVLAEKQLLMKRQIKNLYSHYQDMMLIGHYSYELRKVLLIDDVREALKQHDRKQLQQILQPVWSILKEENYHLKIMHFHKADGYTMLRMHRPEKHSDPIATKRPLLKQMHKKQRPMYSFEAGKHGMFLRIILPIHDEGKYLGAIELGVDPEYIVDGLRSQLGLDGHLFVDKAAFDILEIPYIGNPLINGMMLWSARMEECGCLEAIGSDFDFSSGTRIEDLSGNYYIVHTINLPAVKGAPKASIVLFHDVTFEVDEIHKSLLVILGANIIILLGVLLVLQFATSNLDKKLAHQVYLSGTDPLTLIPNRRKFNQRLEEEMMRCQRYHSILSIVILDIDHFKRVNDKYGHNIGDQVLVELCDVISAQIRISDMMARWGGEEFAIILPSQSLYDAKEMSEKLRHKIEKHQFKNISGITISLGVSEWRKEDRAVDLLKRADTNLYKAKTLGRNCVVVDE